MVRARDRRWVAIAALIVGLTAAGVLYALQSGRGGDSFSTKVAWVYVPFASALIFIIGLSPRGYPVAAGVFYGFIGTAQSTAGTYWLAGNGDGAVTMEMVLAIPLVLSGLMAQSERRGGLRRPLPSAAVLAFPAVVLSGLISTVLARDTGLAAYALLGRFITPAVVTLVTFRRLNGIDEYMLVWWGYVVGEGLIGVYDFRRAVLGVTPAYATINQRFLGASKTYAVAALYAVGPLLWLGHALAVRKSVLAGSILLSGAGAFGVLIWLGAHRGAILAGGLLAAWWALSHFRYLMRGKSLLLFIAGGILILGIAHYSLQRTSLDIEFALDRLALLTERSVTGESRWWLWGKVMELWETGPIFGYGLNNFTVSGLPGANIHGSAVGILFDQGIAGAAVWSLFFGMALWLSRKEHRHALSFIEEQFFRGCRASWICTLVLLAVDLPFTSGQPQSHSWNYAINLFMLLSMTIYARHSLAAPAGSMRVARGAAGPGSGGPPARPTTPGALPR